MLPLLGAMRNPHPVTLVTANGELLPLLGAMRNF